MIEKIIAEHLGLDLSEVTDDKHIIDDLGAIVIIALFYSGDLSIKYLSLMLLAFIVLLVINKFNINHLLHLVLLLYHLEQQHLKKY